jgi:hypothetical protein
MKHAGHVQGVESLSIYFFFFVLSLWIYLWLAETSQQPISQTTWLKVTPHCDHCGKSEWLENTELLQHVTIIFDDTKISCYEHQLLDTRPA